MLDTNDDDMVCRASLSIDKSCELTPPAVPAAPFPYLLVYNADPLAPTTPAPAWAASDELTVAAAATPPDVVAHAGGETDESVHLPFEPLEEPAFARAPDPFVLVRDEYGKEIARGWLPADRTNLVWEKPAPVAARTPLGPPLLEEHLDRLAALRADPDIVELERKAKGGETMAKLLDDARLEHGHLSAWLDAIRGVIDLGKLTRNQRVSLLVDKRDRTLRELSVDLTDDAMLVALRRGAIVVADRVPIPRMKRMRAVGGEIETTFSEAASRADVAEQTVAEMAEILGWELNFTTLRRGASYRAVYEETVRLDTGEKTPGRVLAVEVVDGQQTHDAYYFAANGGDHGSYYKRDGEPVEGLFLRYPVAYTRISSLFSDARFHPIKNRRIPHYGVDFAAPPGTPVVAVADGTVTKAGWLGGSGRLVRIRHDGTYASGYAHLSRIASGLKVGSRVRQGQVIGYVGSSGLATGPHLHFAMYRNGQYVDPLKLNPGHKPALPIRSRVAFQLALGSVDDAWDRAGLSRDAIVQVSMASERAERTSSQ
jgi:murein DD-endopeptidase MepM/ murein hydrolase activator NlpD